MSHNEPEIFLFSRSKLNEHEKNLFDLGRGLAILIQCQIAMLRKDHGEEKIFLTPEFLRRFHGKDINGREMILMLIMKEFQNCISEGVAGLEEENWVCSAAVLERMFKLKGRNLNE